MPWSFEPLPLFGFDVVVIDPAWSFELRSEKGEAKSPQAHYACMSIGDIKALPVGQLVGADSWCFLWTSAPMLDLGFECLKAWEFSYKTRLSWRKVTRNGKVRVGPGYVVRTHHEDILVGAIGHPTYRCALPSLFDGIAREHSRKPDEFYSLVEDFAPDARRVDVFARQLRPNWTVWGNETSKFAEAAA